MILVLPLLPAVLWLYSGDSCDNKSTGTAQYKLCARVNTIKCPIICYETYQYSSHSQHFNRSIIHSEGLRPAALQYITRYSVQIIVVTLEPAFYSIRVDKIIRINKYYFAGCSTLMCNEEVMSTPEPGIFPVDNDENLDKGHWDSVMWQFSADKNVPHLLQCDRDRQQGLSS